MSDDSRWLGDESPDDEEAVGHWEDGELEDADRPDVPVDPGDPELENVAFVVLGAVVALFVLARIAGLV